MLTMVVKYENETTRKVVWGQFFNKGMGILTVKRGSQVLYRGTPNDFGPNSLADKMETAGYKLTGIASRPADPDDLFNAAKYYGKSFVEFMTADPFSDL